MARLLLPALSPSDRASAPAVRVEGLPAPTVSLEESGAVALAIQAPATAASGTHLLTARWPSGRQGTLRLSIGPTLPLASGIGEPDDVVVAPDGSVVVTDLKSNSIRQVLAGHSVRTLLSGLNVPEGVAIDGADSLVFAEQGTNRVLRWSSRLGLRELLQLPVHPGVEGIDGLSIASPAGTQVVLVPDSAGGRVLVAQMDTGITSPIPGHWQRPTDAVLHGDQVYMVDEYGGRMWLGPINGPLHALGPPLSLPDDVVVGSDGTAFVNELSGTILAIRPNGQATPLLQGLHNPQGLALDGAENLILVESDTARISTYVRSCVPLLLGDTAARLHTGGPAAVVAIGSDCVPGSSPPSFMLAPGSLWPAPGAASGIWGGAPGSTTTTLSNGVTASLLPGASPGAALVMLRPSSGPDHTGSAVDAVLEVRQRTGVGAIPVQITTQVLP